MTLDISAAEEELLRTMLARFVAETKGEIYRTETTAYKETLRREQANARSLLAKLDDREAA